MKTDIELGKITANKLPNFQNTGVEVLEPPEMAMLVAVALAYGVSDAGNNLALNSIIGRLFDDRSEVKSQNLSLRFRFLERIKIFTCVLCLKY